jgi:hypothetical protein
MHTRNVIVHYHFFKNAGTSLDHLLKQAFPEAWRQLEADERGAITAERLLDEFREKPELQVISSHTARLSLPTAEDIRVFPLVFLRHPLDRILSVYQFERKQTEETEGSVQARKLDLPAFVEWRLARPRDFSFRNFQAHRLAGLASDCETGDLFERGLKGLQNLPFVGLVEAFDESISVLERWLKPDFPAIRLGTARLNVTQSGDSSLIERLAQLKTTLGPERHARLLRENEADLKLYHHVARMYDRACA